MKKVIVIIYENSFQPLSESMMAGDWDSFIRYD